MTSIAFLTCQLQSVPLANPKFAGKDSACWEKASLQLHQGGIEPGKSWLAFSCCFQLFFMSILCNSILRLICSCLRMVWMQQVYVRMRRTEKLPEIEMYRVAKDRETPSGSDPS